jgi:predicted HAD superfamily phosphohydrolase YqeG
MHPHDKILRSQNADACKELVKQLKQQVGKGEIQDVTGSIILLARKNKAVDPKMINLIKTLQTNNIKVLVLANCATEQFV